MSNTLEIKTKIDLIEDSTKEYSDLKCEINKQTDNVLKYSSGFSNNYHCEKVHISPEKLQIISNSPGMKKLIGIQRLEDIKRNERKQIENLIFKNPNESIIK